MCADSEQPDNPPTPDEATLGEQESCPRCGKPRDVCVCDRSKPIDTRARIVVLQHPQEQDVLLGTAPLLAQNLTKARVIVGLSWRSLGAVAGEDADPKRWAIIFPAKLPETAPPDPTATAWVVDKHGRPVPPKRIDGIIVLDGTWSQAKALWWRNPWLLKLQRVVVAPKEPSIYGAIRKEPRKSYVSTLEAVAEALVALGEADDTRAHLRRVFRTLVQRVRDRKNPGTPRRR